jgi:hypothetical protein
VDLPALDGDDQSDDGYGDWTAEERR